MTGPTKEPRVMAAQRDAAWYNRPDVRSIKQYHVVKVDGCSFFAACDPNRMLLSEYSEVPADEAPMRLRCQRSGCRVRWPR